MLLPVFQPLGSSTHLLAQEVGERHQTKATHTGTLDPMAEGVIVVLTGKDRFKKQELAGWKKTYQFQILWGVSTDTHDLLGLIIDSSTAKIHQENLDTKIDQLLPQFVGTQTQLIPAFSAKRTDGQSYFDLAKQNVKTVNQANSQSTKLTYTQEITIHSIEHLETQEIPAQNIVNQLNKVIPKLTNDFRQEEILQKWHTWIQNQPNQKNTPLLLTTLTATASKRAYIRGLVRDLSSKMGIPATTFYILRTANGPHQIQDCVCLV